MKKMDGNTGKIIEVTGTDPMDSTVSPMIPKKVRMEYTVLTYAAMVPITMSIHATSRVLDQSIMAKKEANAPNTSWLEI